jgi:hypothetical protein
VKRRLKAYGLWLTHVAAALTLACATTSTTPKSATIHIDPEAACLSAASGELEASAMPEDDKRGACRALSSMPDLNNFVVETIAFVVVIPGNTLLKDRATASLSGPAVKAGHLGARCNLARVELGWAVEECSRTLDGVRLQDVDVERARAAIDVVKSDARFHESKIVVVSKVQEADADIIVIVSNSDSRFLINDVIVYLKGDTIVRTRMVKGVV